MMFAFLLLAACSSDLDMGDVYHCEDEPEIRIDLNDGLGYPLVTYCIDHHYCTGSSNWCTDADGIIDLGAWCDEVDTIYVTRVR